MNIDQGSQFTSMAFTGLLKNHGIRISMDGKGSWRQSFRAPDTQCLFGATTRAFTTINNLFTGLQQ